MKNAFYNFLGVGVEAITYNEMEDKIDHWLQDKTSRSHHIACVNAYCVTLALKNDRLKKIYNNADITGPDGMPFVKWIRKFNRLPCDRFYAPAIVHELAKRSKNKKYSFYLYGGAPDVVKNMKDFLEENYPYIKIVGYNSPPFRELTPEEDALICHEINTLRPDIICVGLGTPKQDYWIDEHIYKLRGSILIACGATFDFFGGRIKGAPKYIQESGFEWLYRLFSKDFFRLWHRYTIMNIIFIWNFVIQILNIRVITPEFSIRSPEKY